MMYKVPIVPPDLRHEETIIKAAQSLDCLQKTINSVFGRIDARISKNDARVQEISERIKCANRKIQTLVGTKKAIKIYAPARFPAAHVLRDIPHTFGDRMPAVKIGLNGNQELEEKKQIIVKSKYDEPTPEAIKEKLIFYHVRTEPNDTELTKERKEVNKETGLGTPTEQFQSVTSILRFNTDEFAYGGPPGTSGDLNAWKYKQRSDQRQMRNNKMEQKQKEEKQQLPPAPHSLVHRNMAKLSTPAGDLRYMPAALEAPAMDTPMDLPDLPGIAKDIQFEPIEQNPIAPSSHYFDLLPTFPILPGLTDVIAEHIESATSTIKAEAKVIPVSKTTVTEMKATPVAAPSAAPPPPPPPPPPPTIQQLPNSTAQRAENALRSTSGASSLLTQLSSSNSNNLMCPTSPSNETPLLKEPLKLSAPTFKKAPPPPSLDVRSELMAAIRKVGGASGGLLRAPSPNEQNMDHAVDNNSNFNSTTQNKMMRHNKPSVGGDLMADLHNKLLMRRKGISGSQSIDAQQGAANPVLARLSALIPPPVKSHNSKETDDDDDDDAAAEEWID